MRKPARLTRPPKLGQNFLADATASRKIVDALGDVSKAVDLFESSLVMVQKEVADRLSASPGTRDYGLLSATAQMHGSVRQLFTLPPEAFDPPPTVYSAVVQIRVAPRFAELGVDATGFDKFLKLVFAQKRKTILNNLRNEFEEAFAKDGLEEADIAPSARAETLTLEQMANLYRNLSPAEG